MVYLLNNYAFYDIRHLFQLASQICIYIVLIHNEEVSTVCRWLLYILTEIKILML